MLTPSDLRQGTAGVGLGPKVIVTFAATSPADDAVTVFYRLPDGYTHDGFVSPARPVGLFLSRAERPWSFDASTAKMWLRDPADAITATLARAPWQDGPIAPCSLCPPAAGPNHHVKSGEPENARNLRFTRQSWE